MNSLSISIGIILILVILLIMSFQLSFALARRSICKVIALFREIDAVGYSKAVPLEALGLGPRPFLQFKVLRDYKPWALQTLVQASIVRSGAEGTFYLSEDTLKANPNFESACQIKQPKISDLLRK
jgi:hypothetical protein